MIAARLLDPVRRQWFSEESTLALRSKQFIATVMPESVLLGLKKRYYLGLLRRDGDDRMETDAQALPLLVHRRSPPVIAGSSSIGVVIIGCSRQPPKVSRS